MTDDAELERLAAKQRLYIVMRSDLKMGRGKEIAQAIHAFRYHGDLPLKDDTTVICVRADSLEAFDALMLEAVNTKAPVKIVHDAGRTHNPPGTVTCAAIWTAAPGPLLSAARLY
jgi:peptidyl-tRNA hydrolase